MDLGFREISLIALVAVAFVLIGVFVVKMVLPKKRKLALSQALLRPVSQTLSLAPMPTNTRAVAGELQSGARLEVIDRGDRIAVSLRRSEAMTLPFLVHSNPVAGEVEMRRLPGWSTVEVDDPSFAERFFVASERPEEVLALLGPDLRLQPMRLRSHAAEVVLRPGELSWWHDVQERGGGPKVLELVNTGLEVARLLR